MSTTTSDDVSFTTVFALSPSASAVDDGISVGETAQSFTLTSGYGRQTSAGLATVPNLFSFSSTYYVLMGSPSK